MRSIGRFFIPFTLIILVYIFLTFNFITEELVTVTEQLPYSTEFTDDEQLLNGQTRVVNEGKEGLLAKTFSVQYRNGKEIAKKLTKEEVITEPITKIVARGTKEPVQRSSKTKEFQKTLLMNSTAYTHTGSKTYTGHWPKKGTVAVDPQIIPLGTRLYIDGYGNAVAQDIGSSIKGNRIDLFMDSKAQALNWGKRQVKVYILD